MEVHHRLLEEYAPFRSAQADLEKRTRDRRSRQVAFRAAAPTPINIPLVVHVVWNSAAENISDAQINSQIDALNRDYTPRMQTRAIRLRVGPGSSQRRMSSFILLARMPMATRQVVSRVRKRQTQHRGHAVRMDAQGVCKPALIG